MSERSFPFASSPTATEDDYSRIMRFAATDGVCGSPADTALLPTANGSSNITVAAGEGFCRGQKYILTGTKTLAIPPNAGGSPRLDYVALQNDPGTDQVTAVYVQGGTILPTLTRSFASTWSFPLGAITVPAGASTVAPAGCVDARWFTGLSVSPSNPNYRRDPAYGQFLVEGKDIYVGDGSAYNFLGTAGAPQWSTYTPVWSADATLTWGANAINVGRYKLVGKTCHFGIELQPANNNPASTNALQVTLPFQARNSKRQLSTVHMEQGSPFTTYMGIGVIFAGGTTIGRLRMHVDHAGATLNNATTDYPIDLKGSGGNPNGVVVTIDGTYEIA